MNAVAGIVPLDGAAPSADDAAAMARALFPRAVSFLGGRGFVLDVEGDADPAAAREALEAGRLPDAEGFAAASWDGRRLLLARDPLGVRPLYFAVDGPRVLFASEAKAIVAVLGASPDPVRVREYRAFRFRSAERTFFKGVSRLPAGELLEVGGEGLKRRPLWTPDPDRRVSFDDPSAYAEAFRGLFIEAVRRRLPVAGTVAVTLSGGLDSTAVLGAALHVARAERPGLRFHAVSLLSRDFPDERVYVRAARAHFGVAGTELYFEDLDPAAGLRAALRTQESPFYDAMDAYVDWSYRAARAAGAEVLLGGDWGDQVLTGCAYLADLAREGRWRLFREETAALCRVEGASVSETVKNVLWYLILPNRVRDRYEAFRHFLWPFGRKAGPLFPTAAQRELYDGAFGTHNQMLLELLDRIAARAGLSARFPFLDRRLVEFLLSVPASARVRGGVGKRLLREGLGDFLPPAVLARGDKGDYTDVLDARLAAAGFSTGTRGRDWRAACLDLWEDEWTRKRRSGPTASPAWSPTGNSRN